MIVKKIPEALISDYLALNDITISLSKFIADKQLFLKVKKSKGLVENVKQTSLYKY